MKSFLYKYSILILGFLIVESCATNPVTGKKELMIMSENQEKALGAQSDPGIISGFGLYPDSTLQRFINEKGKQMGKISHRPHLDYQFRVLDSPVVNAFAVPGGYIYFTRGILAHFNNEAEFIGVLGHEIGHVTARHSASQYSKQMVAQLGLVAGLVVSPKFAEYAGIAQQSLGMLFLKFGRDDESQSDGLGVDYSTQIGYDAHEMANFFATIKRLSDKSGQAIPTFLSTHPDPADRFNRVHQLADKAQQGKNRSNLKVNRESYLRMIDGLVYGEDPRQGYVENNNFYHPVLKFQFPIPTGWKTANSPSQFQMGSADGKAMMILTLAQGNSLEEASQKVLEQFKLTLINKKNTTVNGNRAIEMISEQVNEQDNSKINVMSYLIQYSGTIYAFHGVSAAADFANYTNLFLNTMKGFRTLTDPRKINVKPDRVKIRNVNRTGTLSTVLKSFNMPSDRMEELAILNGMKLTDQVQQGSLIKIIGK